LDNKDQNSGLGLQSVGSLSRGNPVLNSKTSKDPAIEDQRLRKKETNVKKGWEDL